MEKITSFTQLAAWKLSHKLVLEVYMITKVFPKDERFALVDQLRRCVVSITSNIAEGFARQSRKEKIQFYYTSLGSLAELQNQILIARDLSYLSKEKFNTLAPRTVEIRKLLNGLIKSAQSK